MVLKQGTNIWFTLPGLCFKSKPYGPEVSHIYKKEIYLHFFLVIFKKNYFLIEG